MTEDTTTQPAGGLIASSSGGSDDFETVPEGVYTARCYRVIDLGTQETTFKGETKHQHKIMFSWELLDDPKMEDGQLFAVHKRYTLSLNDRARLFADLNSWRGKKFTPEELKGFDLQNVIGSYCTIQVTHDVGANGNTYTNVDTIMAFKGKGPDPVNENLFFTFGAPDQKVFETLSDRLQETIKKSPQYEAWQGSDTPPEPSQDAPAPSAKKSQDPKLGSDVALDDIPF